MVLVPALCFNYCSVVTFTSKCFAVTFTIFWQSYALGSII